jgi:hypothetical protein
MITTRFNFLLSIIVVLIALSSLAFNYSLMYNNKKNHITQEMKNYARNTIQQINDRLKEKKEINNTTLHEIINKYTFLNDVPLYFAFLDAKGSVITQNNIPKNFSFEKYTSQAQEYTKFYEKDGNIFILEEIRVPQSIFLLSGFTTASVSSSIFNENFYISIWVLLCIAGYVGFIVYYTSVKIDKPLRDFFDLNLKEFINGILASYTDCNSLKSIENVMLPKGLKNRIENTFGMLQKWSCYKIHFDEFLRITVAESDKKQLINNLYVAVESDFFVKKLTMLEINHSLNRFEPITISANNIEENHSENLLSNPLECLAYRTGNRVLIDESKKSVCSTCIHSSDDTVICKPMMSSGKQTGVIKFAIDNNRLMNNPDINGSKESKIRFLESYLKSYIDLTSLTISNINLLNAYKNQALTDPLTNIYNRRYITEYLYGVLSISKSKESPLSVFMIDIIGLQITVSSLECIQVEQTDFF